MYLKNIHPKGYFYGMTEAEKIAAGERIKIRAMERLKDKPDFLSRKVVGICRMCSGPVTKFARNVRTGGLCLDCWVDESIKECDRLFGDEIPY